MKKILIAASIFFWPLTLFMTLQSESNGYLAGILGCSILFTLATLRNSKYAAAYLTPLGIFSPKLLLIPIVYLVVQNHLERRSISSRLVLLGAPLIIGFSSWSGYVNQSIFTFDYQAQQLVERETKLYPSVFMSRLFHNKARIKTDKFVANTVALTDPNNYFFGFHPRQIVRENLNLKKFPVAIIPLLLWFVLKKRSLTKPEKNLLIFTSIAIVTLATLANFDRADIVLYGPLCAFALASINSAKGRITKFLPLLAIFCIWEMLYLYAMLFI